MTRRLINRQTGHVWLAPVVNGRTKAHQAVHDPSCAQCLAERR